MSPKHPEPSKQVEEKPVEAVETKPVEAAVATPKAPRPPLPTIADLIKEGRSEVEAYTTLVGLMAKRCGKTDDETTTITKALGEALLKASVKVEEVQPEPVDPYYRVIACTPSGRFYRIGRAFTNQPTDLKVADLSPAQIRELEETNPQFLSVTLVGKR